MVVADRAGYAGQGTPIYVYPRLSMLRLLRARRNRLPQLPMPGDWLVYSICEPYSTNIPFCAGRRSINIVKSGKTGFSTAIRCSTRDMLAGGDWSS
jgi:hypothetical protein